MRISVLSDNIGNGPLAGEWGLSFHIGHNGHSYLLDTGASGLFLKNAQSMGIDLSKVEAAVLSHAHYDHSLGMEAFFSSNKDAKFFVSANAGENCYAKVLLCRRYIGMPKGLLSKYADRIVKVSGIKAIADGVWVIPHSAPVDSRTARKAHLFRKDGCRFTPDDFSHEQSLVFETGKGLVIFNSCSHSGPEVILSEVKAALPDINIYAYLGGLHLFRLKDSQVRKFIPEIKDIPHIYTGHCTGDRPYAILKSGLPDTVERFHAGMVIDI